MVMTLITGAEAAPRCRLGAKQYKPVLCVQSLLDSHPGDKAAFENMARKPYTIIPWNLRKWSPKTVPQRAHSKFTISSESPYVDHL